MFRDHLNSTNTLVNGQSNTLWKDLYAPFGDLHYHWDSTPGYTQTQYRPSSERHSSTGQRFDENLASGLYDYVARRYDPSLGRFIQPDTIVPSPSNPQSLNRYSYVLNNPIE